MDHANADNPITIDESVLNCQVRNREDFGPTVNANWPQEASPMVLVIGIYDGLFSDMKPLVYAFVHGPKNNLVAYFLVKPDFSIYRVNRHRLHNVEFEEPFCDLGDPTLGQQTVCNRIRAVVLHYFLAAGHMRKFGNYRYFWHDFTKTCEWIANQGSQPKQQVKMQEQDARPVFATALVPDPNLVDPALNVIAFKKREGDEESKAAPARIKRRDYSHAIRQSLTIISRSSSPEHPIMAISVEARLRASEVANDLLRAEIATQTRSLELYQARVAVNHQLQAQVTSLTAEVSRVKNESMYSQNAYRGIQVQYDDVRVQHANALNDGKGLREQLRQSQSRCKQAEKRSTVLETELERLKRKMRQTREALDDSSL